MEAIEVPQPARRPARPRAWLVLAASFAVATLATAALLVVKAPDPCTAGGLSSGAEGLGYAVLLFAAVGAFFLAVLVVVLVVLVRAGHKTAAMAILAASLGVLAGFALAGEVNRWRSGQATEAKCRALLGLPPPPIRGAADVSLSVDTAPFQGRTTVRAMCELTPDGEGTLWLQVPNDALIQSEARIGSWSVAELWLTQPDDSSPSTLELEAHRFDLVLAFFQPGRSVVYRAQGNNGWALELGPAGTRVITFDQLVQVPEMGGGSSAGAPAAVSGALTWNCTAGEPFGE